MTREEKELIVKVIASATDKVPTETFAKLTRYFFEKKSCESCKHWNKTYKDWYVCTNDICPCYCNATDDDFYCKYWESKDDN